MCGSRTFFQRSNNVVLLFFRERLELVNLSVHWILLIGFREKFDEFLNDFGLLLQFILCRRAALG